MSSVRELGLEVVKFSGGHELLLCPFHPDRTPSAWFSPKKGLFYCSVCNLGLNMEQMAQRLGVEWEMADEVETEIEDYSMFNEETRLVNHPILYNDYIRERGVSEATAFRYGLQYRASGSEAIVFPVTRLNCLFVQGFIYRFINPTGARYQRVGTMTQLWPMHLLGGGDVEHLIVTEGGWSAMRIAPHLERGEAALSLMGAKANDKIVEAVRGFESVVFLYDEDSAGDTACRKMRRLAPFAHSFTLPISPDDMDEHGIVGLLRKVRKL